MERFDCVIIGSGVAGMTSAIYLKRANKKVLILEKEIPGGQITRSSLISNYPGVSSIDGPTLALNIYNQMTENQVDYRYGDVLSIQDGNPYKVVVTEKETFETKTIIIASGRSPRELGLPNEKSLTGHGVSWCAICDGPLYKEKTVAVVGGGSSALEEALYLSSLCSKVYLIHRRDTFKGEASLVEKVNHTKNIECIFNVFVTGLKEKENLLSSICLNDHREIEVSGLFIYIGATPNTHFLKDLNLMMNDGYIVVDKNMKTNIDGIYACGDVIKKEFYQISTAVGEGATAALSIKNICD